MAHGEVYWDEFGWDASMEAFIARIVADYAAGRDPRREAAWIAERDRRRVGCIFCVADPDDPACGRLRLLLVHPDGRGHNLGRRLIDALVEFARGAGYERIRLWTNHPLAAARHLYLEKGFELIAEEPHHSFGVDLVGQIYELDLRGSSTRLDASDADGGNGANVRTPSSPRTR
ncbi:MAG TPA: GNAT family N-acetyltransferase [Solirubrobacteraceae bacterium]|nr:GNAT family N-acetyltransferase [Solirubrobacteraceae bacterium]